MEIKDNDKVILNADETILFGSMMHGIIKGIDEKRKEELYISKEEKDLYKMAKDVVEELEEKGIL